MTQSLSFKSRLEEALSAEGGPSLAGVLAALDTVTRRLDDDPRSQQVLGQSSIIRAGDVAQAARLIARCLSSQPPELRRWTQTLLAHAEPGIRNVGILLLPDVYGHYPRQASAQLKRFAGDEGWVARETAGAAAGRVLNEHFAEFYPDLQAWTAHRSENVRRAVAIAVMKGFDRKHPQPERGEPLLALLDPLVTDRTEYVRVNLGQFAIGAMLLPHYPQPTLKRLRTWAKLADESARWNVAMVWTAAGAHKHAEEGVKLLSALAGDERRFVWRAVASAMVKLARARPEVCRPVIEAWAADPRRAHVAQVVQGYLAKR